MGNICGKESADPFAQPGRTLGSAPPPNSGKRTSSLPTQATTTKTTPRKVGGPARTLGSASPEGNSTVAGGGSPEDARRRAAEAAEARANAASKPKGKLGAQLQEQKKQTRTDTLGAASAEERAHRQLQDSQQQQRYD